MMDKMALRKCHFHCFVFILSSPPYQGVIRQKIIKANKLLAKINCCIEYSSSKYLANISSVRPENTPSIRNPSARLNESLFVEFSFNGVCYFDNIILNHPIRFILLSRKIRFINSTKQKIVINLRGYL